MTHTAALENITTTKLTEAIKAAISINEFEEGDVIDIDAAVEAIKAGDVEPWNEFAGDDLAEAFAMGVVMNDGPWWSSRK